MNHLFVSVSSDYIRDKLAFVTSFLSQVLGYNYSSSREQIVSMPVVLCSPYFLFGCKKAQLLYSLELHADAIEWGGRRMPPTTLKYYEDVEGFCHAIIFMADGTLQL
jgi:hypothetical protein